MLPKPTNARPGGIPLELWAIEDISKAEQPDSAATATGERNVISVGLAK